MLVHYHTLVTINTPYTVFSSKNLLKIYASKDTSGLLPLTTNLQKMGYQSNKQIQELTFLILKPQQVEVWASTEQCNRAWIS